MLNGYIKIEDIETLIKKSEQIDGYINKHTFQQAITKLKEYRKPSETNKDKIIFKRTTISDMVGNIIKYQHAIKSNPVGGDLGEWMKKEKDILISPKAIFTADISLYKEKCLFETKQRIIKNEHVIFEGDKILEVLGISKTKLQKLRRLNIVVLYLMENVTLKDYETSFRIDNCFFYDLEDIANRLKEKRNCK